MTLDDLRVFIAVYEIGACNRLTRWLGETSCSCAGRAAGTGFPPKSAAPRTAPGATARGSLRIRLLLRTGCPSEGGVL
jgi:hypothetical protein